MQMIFRIDDVSANTDMDELLDIITAITEIPFESQILIGINLISQKNSMGSVYPGAPFKDREKSFFYNVNRMFPNINFIRGRHFELASHGLLHADHSRLDYDAQEMSIVSSCNLLGVRKFISPFNRYNEDTIRICNKHDIEFVYPELWKSLDYEALVMNQFNLKQLRWYLHPWRWSGKAFREHINSKFDGLVSSDTKSIAG